MSVCCLELETGVVLEEFPDVNCIDYVPYVEFYRYCRKEIINNTLCFIYTKRNTN